MSQLSDFVRGFDFIDDNPMILFLIFGFVIFLALGGNNCCGFFEQNNSLIWIVLIIFILFLLNNNFYCIFSFNNISTINIIIFYLITSYYSFVNFSLQALFT